MASDEAIKADIVQIVLEHWANDVRPNQPMLLARLGQFLSRRGHNLREVSGGLRAFIDNAVPEVQTIADPKDDKVFWVTPCDVDTAKVQIPEKAPSPSQPQLKIDRRVVAALTKPIGDGRVRTVTLEPEIRFDDVHESAAVLSGKPIIRAADLVHSGEIEGDREKLTHAILDWARRNGLSEQSLRPRRIRERPTRGTLMHSLIEALDTQELARVSLPLDVVAKLLRTGEH